MTDHRTLVLERPLVSFDLETTGLDIENDRIVELSCVKLSPDGSREVRTRRINPGIPIPEAATQVHGIRDADVADAPRFAQVASAIRDFLSNCDLTGFNIEKFDLPFLCNEFKRAGIEFPTSPIRVIDSFKIYVTHESRNLASALRFYCGKQLENAHSAEADAVAAADILIAQIKQYDDLPTSIGDLHEALHQPNPDWADPDGKFLWRNGEVVFGFGKCRNLSLRTVAATDAKYLRWIADSDFSETVKSLINDALAGKYHSRES